MRLHRPFWGSAWSALPRPPPRPTGSLASLISADLISKMGPGFSDLTSELPVAFDLIRCPVWELSLLPAPWQPLALFSGGPKQAHAAFFVGSLFPLRPQKDGYGLASQTTHCPVPSRLLPCPWGHPPTALPPTSTPTFQMTPTGDSPQGISPTPLFLKSCVICLLSPCSLCLPLSRSRLVVLPPETSSLWGILTSV